MTQVLEADWTWVDDRFESGVQVEVGDDGRIVAVGPSPEEPSERLYGCALLPGFVNAHSHAFQRGLRGRGERFPAGAGSFWTWREAMYELVESITPERMHALTLSAFREMLAAGMTTVGEFHYLHHADAGARDHALDTVVLEAARAAGIRIVLLQACYQSGGFGADGARTPIGPAQRRFHTPDVDDLWRSLGALEGVVDAATQSLGVVIHSVRAVLPDAIGALLAGARERGLVLHVHLEEQRREVEDCLAATGRTPMQLLLERAEAAGLASVAGVTAVHCTHTSDEDMGRFLEAGGSVCLTPTTEASLGDGIPRFPQWLRDPERFALGSDSNTRISMFEELRWAEYAQRLAREARGIAAAGDEGRVGPPLLAAATRGGARALGLRSGALAPGHWGDLVAVDLTHPTLDGTRLEDLAETLALAADERILRATYVGGRRRAD